MIENQDVFTVYHTDDAAILQSCTTITYYIWAVCSNIIHCLPVCLFVCMTLFHSRMRESLYEELVKVKWGELINSTARWFPQDDRFVKITT